MQSATSLLDFILSLLRDQHTQSEFHAHPEHVLARHGLQNVCASDIHDTMPLVTDQRGVQLSHGHDSTPWHDSPGDGNDMHGAIRVLEHITKNYTWNETSNHTVIDDSVHQNIWALGDVTQTFDNTNVVASGHAVAAGGSISGTVTTGNGDAVGTGAAVGTGNVTGTGNAVGAGSVVGNDNNVANGAGSSAGTGNVTGHVTDSQVATTGGSNSTDNHSVTNTNSGNTDLHSYGAGSTNTIGNGNNSLTATNSGNDNGSHNVSDSGNDSGNTTTSTTTSTTNTTNTTNTTTDSNDGNGNHIDHNLVGDSYSSTSTDHSYDTHDPSYELHIH